MEKIWISGLIVLFAVGISPRASCEVEAVSASESETWLSHTVPLPKTIEITGKVTLEPGEVGIVSQAAHLPLVRQGIKELREALKGSEEFPLRVPGAFTLSLELNGPAANDLKELKNFEQAYSIVPFTEETGLTLAAVDQRGLYYACKTLQQLILAKRTEQQVQIPLVKITDWPDMQDRGLWGSETYLHLRWLSDRKINYLEQIATSTVEGSGKHTSSLSAAKKQMVLEGPTYGVQPVPAVVHLEQMGRGNLFEIYPELKAQGGERGAICYAQPLFVDILADWIEGYARMPGVTEVDVWMTENLHGKGGCQCAVCKEQNRDVQEIKVILEAWRKAKERVPVVLRILTSEETDDSNEEVFNALPSDVKIWYYHSLWTYFTAETEIIPDCLEQVAKEGRYAGVCPNICAEVGLYQPFTGAQFIHYRMNEFVDKGLSGLLAYAVPATLYNAFNIEAAAEWTWNAKGRTPHEFALSYAIRKGYSDPELFAKWSDLHGPVAWDIYGSQWPRGENRGALERVSTQLLNGKLPELGFMLWGVYTKPWGDIKSEQQLKQGVKDVGDGDHAHER